MSSSNSNNTDNVVGGETQLATEQAEDGKKKLWSELVQHVVLEYNKSVVRKKSFSSRRLSKQKKWAISDSTLVGPDGELYDGCSYNAGNQFFGYEALMKLNGQYPESDEGIKMYKVSDILKTNEITSLCEIFAVDYNKVHNATIGNFLLSLFKSLQGMNTPPDLSSIIKNKEACKDDEYLLSQYIEQSKLTEIYGNTLEGLQDVSAKKNKSWLQYLIDRASNEKKEKLAQLLKFSAMYPGNSQKNVPWYERFTDWINRKWFRWKFGDPNYRQLYNDNCRRDWYTGRLK